MSGRHLPRFGSIAVSLTITAAVALIAAWLLMPHFHHRYMLSLLSSLDPAERDRALVYVRNHAGADPRVTREAVAAMEAADAALFIQVVEALDHAGQWGRGGVTDRALLRWISMLHADPDPEARILAAQHAAQLADVPDPEQVECLLGRLLDDDQPEVRYNAVVALAELSAATTSRDVWRHLLVRALDDREPEVARHGWLFAGLLSAVPTTSPDWRNAAPRVVDAMLWATVQTRPDGVAAALDAIRDESADPRTRAAAAYALQFASTQEVTRTLRGLLRQGSGSVDDVNRIVYWRTILGVEVVQPDAASEGDRFMDGLTVTPLSDRLRPLLAAVLSKDSRVGRNYLNRTAASDRDPLLTLAALEGLKVGEFAEPIPSDAGDLIRLAAAAVVSNPDPRDWYRLFAANRAEMRDLACVVAAQRCSDAQIEKLVASLMGDYDDTAKMSGAVLAGLTGSQSKLLERKWKGEDVWIVKRIQELGLWMQGRRPCVAATTLLVREDVPRSTVLLAMLHADRTAALDYLLNPRGDLRLDLVELLHHYRWWHVLRRYLPPGAPPFWLWADPGLQAFQVEVLRNWYLVNRAGLSERGGDSVETTSTWR